MERYPTSQSPSDQSYPDQNGPGQGRPPQTRPPEPWDRRGPTRFRQAPDPGSKRSGIIALVLAIVLGGSVVLMQNVPPVIEMFSSSGAQTDAEAPSEVPPPVPGSMSDTLGKLYIKMSGEVRKDPNAMPMLDRYAANDAERTRLIVVEAELNGEEAAQERAEELLDTLDAADPIAEDVRDLETIYTEGPGALPEGAAERLKQHHTYFGEVALSHGLPDTDPVRRALLGGAKKMLVVLGGFGLIVAFGLLGGCTLFIVMLVLALTGRLRPRMPLPTRGGSVFLEVFALFVGGFLLLQLVTGGIGAYITSKGGDPTKLFYAKLGAQWLLLVTPFWPLLRGMNFSEWRQAIGFNTGRGLLKEMGLGFVAYLAGLPLFFAGAVLTLILMVLAQLLIGGENTGAPTSSPVIDLVSQNDPLALFLIFTLATIWAPLCEEMVFRGALHRYIRGYAPMIVAVLGSATVFGFMHGYGPLFVFPLIALGSVFSLMREWRGSLVPSMTAHWLHNTTVLTFVIVLVSMTGS